MQSSAIWLHSQSSCHRRAAQAFLSPDTPVSKLTQATAEDSQLLCGSVPQLGDWLRTWRVLKSPLSFATAEKLSYTESFIACVRIDCRAVSQRAFRSMALVMHEVVRERKVAALRESTSVSLSFDDRGGTASSATGHAVRGVSRTAGCWPSCAGTFPVHHRWRRTAQRSWQWQNKSWPQWRQRQAEMNNSTPISRHAFTLFLPMAVPACKRR